MKGPIFANVINLLKKYKIWEDKDIIDMPDKDKMRVNIVEG